MFQSFLAREPSEISMRLLFALILSTTMVAATSPDVSDLAATAKVIYVNEGAAPDGNGSYRFPFRNLPAAVAKAKSTTGDVVIRVAPGRYPIDSTLVIDRSLALIGSTEIIESASGFPTDSTVPGTATRIVGGEGMGSSPIITVGRPDGVVIDGVTIRGFIFKGAADFFGAEINFTRVQGVKVTGNVFGAPGRFGIESIASSGQILGNHMSLLQTGTVIAGGYPASPSKVTFKGNRSVSNGLGGVLLDGASIFIPELGDRVDAVVSGNDLSGNENFGVRLFILARVPGFPGDNQETGHIHALLKGNRIHDNAAGILLDAGFPFRELGEDCDPRIFSGTIDLELEDNNLAGNFDFESWVIFTRWPGNADDPSWQYLHASRFTITDPQRNFGQISFDNPKRDPYVGPCPNDDVHELLGNVLIYNGKVIPSGRNY